MVETGMMPEEITGDGDESILQENDGESYTEEEAPEMAEEDD